MKIIAVSIILAIAFSQAYGQEEIVVAKDGSGKYSC